MNNRVAGYIALERLEPCAGKLACTVLRRVAIGNNGCLSDFAFVGRQYKLIVGGDLFYIDLLFYHLKLRNYVVVELKNTDFKPEYVGQVNFYLSAIDDLVKHPDDGATIGLILCKNKSNIIAEYALRDVNSPIGIAEFRTTGVLPEELKTALPSIEELEFELSKQITQVDSDKQ